MPSERSSPSGGWREVYDAMDADANAEEPQPCRVCGRPSSTRIDGPFCRRHRPERENEAGRASETEGGSGESGGVADGSSSAAGDGRGGDSNRGSRSRGRIRHGGLTRFVADGGGRERT